MGKLSEAYVDIGANLKPMQEGLGRAKAMLTSFAGRGISLALGAGLGGGGIAAGLLAATKKAADLGESVSKVRVTFGGAAEAMIGQADDLAKKFGVVKQETLDAASAFGLMGRAAGMSQEASARLGQDFVQLGLDIASFHNLSNQEAFEKLRSGLAGESEPLRPLGIMLSEDAVKAEALAMGLVRVKRELTDQEKILARVSLIKRQAGPAVGDLERTADSAANQMRKLEGELINAAVEFGEKLIPALQDGVKLAHEIGDAIRGATGEGFSENVGELTRASVNATRAAVNPETRGVVVNSAFNHMPIPGLDKMVGRKPLVEAIAAAAGLPLAAGPAPDNAAQQRQRMAAGLAARDARDNALAAEGFQKRLAAKERARLVDLGMTPEQLGLGGTLAAAVLGGDVNRIPRAFEEDAAERKRMKGKTPAELRQEALKPREFGGPGAVEPPAFQSQTFASGADFARAAIEKVLSSEEDQAKKQTQELEAMSLRLEDLKAIGQGFLERIDKSPPLRAILRGPS